MSFLITHPEVLTAAADTLAGVGTAMSAQNEAAAAVTTDVAPPAADAVSAQIAAQLGAHAANYQAVGAQATALHDMFVATLRANAGSYAAAESANAVAAGLGG